MNTLINYLKMIKIEHSIFALPFALTAMILAANGFPSFRIIFWIIFCMVSARSGAMGINRWADADIDAKNARTASREIPSGKISKNSALMFTILSLGLFIFGTYKINPLSFKLSLLPVGLFFIYSYSKRFTMYCHFILGICLGFAPLGAWIAVTGEFSIKVIPISIAVLFWSAGFDLIYSLQDREFDVKEDLHSIPSRLGDNLTLVLARILHILAFSLFVITGILFNLNYFYYIGILVVGIMLLYEHILIYVCGLEKINIAFFNANALISIVIFISTLISVFSM